MANQKPRSTTQKKKTGPSSRGTSKSGGGSSKRSTKGKSTIKSKLIYELEIILLVVFTVISVFSIHTGAVGYFGTLLKGLYFGLFSKVAVIVPYFVMFIVFVNINPNLEKVRTKYNIALGSTLLAIILFYSTVVYEISIEALSISKANIFSIAGIKEIYFSAIRGNGAGVFGMYISHLFISLFGTVGSYVIAIGLILAGIILGTKVSLSDIWRIQKNMATATTNKAIQIAKNTGEAIADSMQPSEEQETGEVVESAKPQKKSFKIFDSDSYLPTKEASSSKTESNDQSTNSTKEPSVSFSEDNNKQIKISTFDGDSKIEEVDAKQADITVEKINTNANPTTGKETSANDGKGTKEKKENQKLDPNEVKEVSDALDKATHETYENYVIPSVSLLKKNTSQVSTNKQEILAKAKLLEETLGNFGVEAKVVEISKGPAITMFELQPSPGVKVSKIVNLSDDIALSLAASQVRIIAPIPGKSAVGIEIPNKDTSLVTLRDVLDTKEFKDNKSKLTFALGKDISGNPILSDLSKMPHLLIAGATGSGKSVCVNTLITSILFNATPDEVKFLMIDPKVVELNNYNGIPHLILPVVTDPKKASIALNWAVQEMTRRYQMFAETGVRDVNSYNVKATKESLEKLPKIVVIIDELADLMMVAPNQVEDAICRLAQMARAAGIHLIVATQRPSVDVITGLIKANIPSRIAFSVSSMTDSRTILDMGGAEKLLGKGDMLFYPVGSSKPQRVQGAFVSDEEVENLVSFVKGQSQEVVYNDSILEEATFETSNNNNCDEYLEDAIEFVVRSQQASISMLQRKFRVGYNRAARLVDEMEERGIIGPSLGSKPREVLLDSSELENLN